MFYRFIPEGTVPLECYGWHAEESHSGAHGPNTSSYTNGSRRRSNKNNRQLKSKFVLISTVYYVHRCSSDTPADGFKTMFQNNYIQLGEAPWHQLVTIHDYLFLNHTYVKGTQVNVKCGAHYECKQTLNFFKILLDFCFIIFFLAKYIYLGTFRNRYTHLSISGTFKCLSDTINQGFNGPLNFCFT